MRIVRFLFFLGLFFLPFNSFEGYKYIGEFTRDGSILFFLPIPILAILLKGKFIFPANDIIYQAFLLFFIWIVFSMTLNLFDAHEYYFKGMNGYTRFTRQIFSLLISSVYLFLGYYLVFRGMEPQKLFFTLRKVIFFSFVLVSAYAFLEFLILRLHLTSLEKLIKVFDFFPFTEVKLDYRNRRLSSVTFEPPALATYLFSVSGWMFSYIVTGKGVKKYIPGLIVVFLCLFSGSRSSLFFIGVQLAAFVWVLLRKKDYRKYFKRVLIYSLIAGLFAGALFGRTISAYIIDKATSFSIKDDQLSNSNKSRLGIYTASWLVFLENPIVGAGYGQQAFLAKDKYPDWAVKNNWEFRDKYLNENDPSFPPGYNLYLRLLAETGLIGLLIFALFSFMIVTRCLKLIKSDDDTIEIFGLVLFVSMIGFFLNWFKMDTFRVYGFWIGLALLIVVNTYRNEVKS
ncbi:O-antigen polymerase [Allomuricauda ruestringensis DSM 13258]|uniref:O-antigen polymerase n=1 Tax=Allomuricauda ruestringensis (strain DSM 13258 / CIP 107369 / LMG 19739 / B1) TaxID=886377 RepID=G2PPM8_ALLRU|nr:O-antigen ligase family protein [Allomuricauda ruestringensis]AEM70409.1 O-antigen polymerase [Allomuricauda ruestringensis DSM 13258]